MGRRGVQVEIILFDVLAVIPLRASEPEDAFLEDRILAVPKRQGKT